ncbi:hybrid sensor histidine kinase/response regulator [Horticoccus sp. 23ND18S-11]|uniref:hybrid sensor histidine kinase/response regulator n=1 Tax=Horticoccus sp. 23ND18S-11 TaxID=3391832 RepID=UPI0039C9D9BE
MPAAHSSIEPPSSPAPPSYLPAPTRDPASLAAVRTVGVYVLVAVLWIWLSDWALFALAPSTAVAATFALLKGWIFVAVTAVLLFWMLRAQLEQGRAQEERLRLFIQHAPVALAMFDREMRYLMVSARWTADRGLGSADLRGRVHYEVFPDLPARWRELHQRALAGETLREDADRFERPDGSVQWVRWELRPWLDAGGKVGGIVLFTEDISFRKQAQEELESSRARLRLALECGRAGTWSWDLATGRIECDDATARLVGRTAEEFARGGLDVFNASLHPDDRGTVERALEAALVEGRDFFAEYRVFRPDGQVLNVTNRGRVEQDATGRPVRIMGACVDVTDARRMERALSDSEERFREVVETIREVFWISDVEKNKVLYVSPAFEEIWGVSSAEIYASARVWVDAIHPGDRERVVRAAKTTQTAGTYDEVYRVLRPDASIRWVRDRAYPVRNDAGVVVRIVGTAEDVTDGKRLEEQFLRAQRLEAIGTLASGVAHDLNNILAPMLMIAPMLKPKLAESGDRDMLTIVERSAQRGADVVKQLLTFSRGIAGERGPLQVRHLVKEMVAIMRETFPREIGIAQQIPAELPPLVGDATQLHQVLMNLCVNARDAMPKGGRLSIHAEEVALEVADVRPYQGVKPGRFVVLTVADTGEGIAPAVLTRIFEPFFTTKGVGSGTGLGLSTVLGIVTSHEGFVTVDSELGRGSSFHVHLPAGTKTPSSGVPFAVVDSPVGGGELVLVVDDEPAVRHSTQRVLEKYGYRVLTAANGREGLALYLLQRDQVRAVVTDLMMPEMGGIALVRALRELSPGLAILAATGLEDAGNRAALGSFGVSELLPKPYAPAELLAALDRELKKAAAGAES